MDRVEREKKKKKSLRKRPCLLTKEELVRGEGANFQTVPQVVDLEEMGGPTFVPTFTGEPSSCRRDDEECLATTLLATLSKARSKVEEELEVSLEWGYTEGIAKGERANCLVAFEMEAVNFIEALDLYTAQLKQERLKEEEADLLSSLVAAQVEQDEVVNDTEAVKVETLGLLAKLVASRSKAKAHRACGVKLYASGGEP
ncbi:hypothetical protein ACLOJK_039235 [Asimina triloba]